MFPTLSLTNNSVPWHDYVQKITLVTIGEGVTNIGNYAFDSCTELKEISLNYSRNSIWTGNCTMNPKIDPCSLNIAQPIAQKGIKSLWQSSERLLSCQGSLIVTIPAVHSAYRYLKVSHRIHFYKGSCYTAWMWYILLNELLLQQSSAILNGRYQCVAFAYLLITPIF